MDLTAEQFAQRAYDANIIDARKLESVWGELGSREAPAEDLKSLLLRRELLTNWQVERLLSGKKGGFYYGNYKILYLIGAGTFARVYRAVEKGTDKVVAVKVLRTRYSNDLEKTEQFMREAEMVKELRHPNIVPIFDVHSERGSHYMVMDFVEGQNLRDFVKMRGKLTIPESVRLITDVANGLSYAYKKGVSHRDLKLSNVLITSRGVGRLVDFGLAAMAGTAPGDPMGSGGTPRSIDYAGLERATGVRRDDKRSDIFFAGCMFYHMLSGHSPLAETRDRIQRLSVSRYKDIKPITTWEPELPLRILNVVTKSMDINPDSRYKTPGEMLMELEVIGKALDAGELRTAETSAAANAAAVAALNQLPERLEGESRTVMIVESNVTLQDVLRDKLKTLGYRVLVISNPERALGRFDFGGPDADCVVFGTGELGVEALEAFNKFAANPLTEKIPAILLASDKQPAIVRAAKLCEHRVLVSMPLKFRELREVLRKLLVTKSSST